MTAMRFSVPSLECTIRDVCVALDKRDRASSPWSTYSEDDLWRELVSCILGSRVRFETAYAAVERMNDMRLLSGLHWTGRFDQYEQDIMTALSKGYPFYRVRANQIRHAADRLYGLRGSIREYLENVNDVRDARRLLVNEVPGLGPKQASLFLRNIGYAKHVAVLDAHVLTYMSWVGLTDVPIKSVSTLCKYETLEESFIEYARSF